MDRVAWRKGGLRRTTGEWIPELGKTGFYRNRRIIEEPNPLSIYLRQRINSSPDGHYCLVDGDEIGLTSYEDVIDSILSHADVSDLVGLVLVRNSQSDCADAPSHWILLRPRGRMTPMETWIVRASDFDLDKREIFDD